MEPKENIPLRVLALVSGGVESALLLKELLAEGHTVIPCYVECGMRWEAAERAALERLLGMMAHERLEALVVLTSPVGDCLGEHWGMTGLGVPDSASPDEAVELPGRNLLLISKAAVYASRCAAEAVALGPLRGNPFPDATEAFFTAIAEAASLALGRRVDVLAPLIKMDKVEVLKRSEGLPLELTFSCISPSGGAHCGRCNKCAERMRAFAASGLADPTTYETKP